MHSKTNNSVPDNMEIAPGYTVRDWRRLQLDKPQHPDWTKAIEIFESRICHRFIAPVDVLIAHEIGHKRGTFGFAILAIDCLIMETLQGFRNGEIDHDKKSKKLICTFLTESSQFRNFFKNQNEAVEIFKHYRCALLHSGKTDGDFRIQRHGPLLRRDGTHIDINRTAFHEAIKLEFRAYLEELADSSNTGTRKNFRKTMNAICSI